MKEWKGNSNSAHAAIAAHRGGGKTMRQEDDFYATDPKAIEALFSAPCFSHTQVTELYLKNAKNDPYFYFWKPAAGNGNLSDWLRQNGYKVVASDLKDRGGNGVLSNLDFLKTKNIKWQTADMLLRTGSSEVIPFVIITNPPYSLATEFIEHALNILPDGGLYIALMNITYLAGQKRYQCVYSKGSLREIYVFSKRIECWKNGERPKDKCGSIANYAWYVFQKGYNGQPTLYWL